MKNVNEGLERSENNLAAPQEGPRSKILRALRTIVVPIIALVASSNASEAHTNPTEKFSNVSSLDQRGRVGNRGDWDRMEDSVNERSAYILSEIRRLTSLAGNPDTITPPILNDSQQECLARMTEIFSLLAHPNSLMRTETTLFTMDTQKAPEFNSYAKSEIIRLLGPYFPDPMTQEQQAYLIEVLQGFVKSNPLDGLGPESSIPTENSAE